MTTSPKFWDRHAKGYAKSAISDEASYQKKLAVTQGYFRPDMQVFEFGCGTGSTALVHAPYVKHIHAIDISTNMIEIARGKAAADGVSNIDFQVAGIDDFDAPDASYDAVLALSILHLVDDRQTVMGKVFKLLKPGGIFVTSTACLGDKMWFFKFLGPVGRAIGLLPVLRVFTRQQMRDSFAAAGFVIDHDWAPERGLALFIVAKKPD